MENILPLCSSLDGRQASARLTLLRAAPTVGENPLSAPIVLVDVETPTMAARYHPTQQWKLFIFGSIILLLTLSGCVRGQLPRGEEYELSSLRVVFLDAPQIQAKYEEIAGKSAVMMTPRLVLDTHRREEVVVGFYDFHTHTIYCPKMDFEICGHELHHAVLGQFHLQ